MITTLLITILPTIYFLLLLPKIGIHPQSKYLKITFAWFAGLYCFTLLTFMLSIIYSFFISSILVYALYTSIIIFQILFIFLFANLRSSLVSALHKFKIKNFLSFTTIAIVFFCIWFSYIFYIPHLQITNNVLFTSPIYWDFHWHVGVIQNFVYGDNFPPQNESFAGIPMVYHFFTDFLMAIYSTAGLDIATAVTFTSVLFFFFLLLSFIGISEEFFQSKAIGIITILLFITSGSLHFIHYFYANSHLPLYQIIESIFTNSTHPWKMSFIPGNPFNYTGVMFNLFYYVEERHAVLGIVYLCLALWIIYNRKIFSPAKLLIFGAVLGGFFLWHIFLPLIVIIILSFLLVFDKDKKHTILLLSGLLTMYLFHIGIIKVITNSYSVFNTAMTHYPRINLEFTAERPLRSPIDYIVSVFGYFIYGYGLKIVLIPISLFTLYKINKSLGILLSAGIIPLFIIINVFQISPNGTSENHKLLLPMTVLINIVTAYVLHKAFFAKPAIANKIYGITLLFCLTISGLLELMPFLNSKPIKIYANMSQSHLTSTIQQTTQNNSVFVGTEHREIHLAGRKLFVGESAGPSDSIDDSERKKIVLDIYSATEKRTFCTLTKESNITHVILHNNDVPYKYYYTSLTLIPTLNTNAETVFITDIEKSCNE